MAEIALKRAESLSSRESSTFEEQLGYHTPGAHLSGGLNGSYRRSGSISSKGSLALDERLGYGYPNHEASRSKLVDPYQRSGSISSKGSSVADDALGYGYTIPTAGGPDRRRSMGVLMRSGSQSTLGGADDDLSLMGEFDTSSIHSGQQQRTNRRASLSMAIEMTKDVAPHQHRRGRRGSFFGGGGTSTAAAAVTVEDNGDQPPKKIKVRRRASIGTPDEEIAKIKNRQKEPDPLHANFKKSGRSKSGRVNRRSSLGGSAWKGSHTEEEQKSSEDYQSTPSKLTQQNPERSNSAKKLGSYRRRLRRLSMSDAHDVGSSKEFKIVNGLSLNNSDKGRNADKDRNVESKRGEDAPAHIHRPHRHASARMNESRSSRAKRSVSPPQKPARTLSTGRFERSHQIDPDEMEEVNDQLRAGKYGHHLASEVPLKMNDRQTSGRKIGNQVLDQIDGVPEGSAANRKKLQPQPPHRRRTSLIDMYGGRESHRLSQSVGINPYEGGMESETEEGESIDNSKKENGNEDIDDEPEISIDDLEPSSNAEASSKRTASAARNILLEIGHNSTGDWSRDIDDLMDNLPPSPGDECNEGTTVRIPKDSIALQVLDKRRNGYDEDEDLFEEACENFDDEDEVEQEVSEEEPEYTIDDLYNEDYSSGAYWGELPPRSVDTITFINMMKADKGKNGVTDARKKHTPNFVPAHGSLSASDYVVRSFVARLRIGLTVTKHSRSRWVASHDRMLHILPDGYHITWIPEDEEELAKLKKSAKAPPKWDLTKCMEIRHAWTKDPKNSRYTGTATLRLKCKDGKGNKSFALIFPHRTVDFTAKTTDQCRLLMDGFSALCYRLKQAKMEQRDNDEVETCDDGATEVSGISGLDYDIDASNAFSITATNQSSPWGL